MGNKIIKLLLILLAVGKTVSSMQPPFKEAEERSDEPPSLVDESMHAMLGNPAQEIIKALSGLPIELQETLTYALLVSPSFTLQEKKDFIENINRSTYLSIITKLVFHTPKVSIANKNTLLGYFLQMGVIQDRDRIIITFLKKILEKNKKYLAKHPKKLTVNMIIPKKERTLLQRATQKGKIFVVDYLLANGADPNLVGVQLSNPPLIIAAQNGFKNIVLLLLKAGATVSPEKGPPAQPLMQAILEGHKEIARLLIENGAKINHIYNLREGQMTLLDYFNHLIERESPAYINFVRQYRNAYNLTKELGGKSAREFRR